MKTIRSILQCSLLFFSVAYGRFSDNRFIPWYTHNAFLYPRYGSMSAQLFFITGNSAYGNEVREKRGLFEIYGDFDQVQIGQAAQAVGVTDPLNPVWQAEHSIVWHTHGKLQGQGCAFALHKKIGDYVSFSFSTNVLHLGVQQKFVLPVKVITDLSLSPEQQQDIDTERREVLRNLGFTENHWSRTGFANTNMSVRLGTYNEYSYKCRYLSAGMTFGVAIPSAKRREKDNLNPVYIPFNADGGAGMLWSIDVQAELKEGLRAGLQFDIVKRLAKIQTRRLSVKGEPENFGATQGEVKIDPGVTLLFSPFLALQGVREGWNFSLQYVFQYHANDEWVDKRNDTTIPVNFDTIIKMSEWRTEYLLFEIEYDGGSLSERNLPIVTFGWDIPVKILKPEESVKAQKVSIGVKYNF